MMKNVDKFLKIVVIIMFALIGSGCATTVPEIRDHEFTAQLARVDQYDSVERKLSYLGSLHASGELQRYTLNRATASLSLGSPHFRQYGLVFAELVEASAAHLVEAEDEALACLGYIANALGCSVLSAKVNAAAEKFAAKITLKHLQSLPENSAALPMWRELQLFRATSQLALTVDDEAPFLTAFREWGLHVRLTGLKIPCAFDNAVSIRTTFLECTATRIARHHKI